MCLTGNRDLFGLVYNSLPNIPTEISDRLQKLKLNSLLLPNFTSISEVRNEIQLVEYHKRSFVHKLEQKRPIISKNFPTENNSCGKGSSTF